MADGTHRSDPRYVVQEDGDSFIVVDTHKEIRPGVYVCVYTFLTKFGADTYAEKLNAAL